MGLLDEMLILLVPILHGKGTRLLEHLGASPIELECTRVIDALGLIHLQYRVVKDKS